jgi:hypothetical protein
LASDGSGDEGGAALLEEGDGAFGIRCRGQSTIFVVSPVEEGGDGALLGERGSRS